MEVKIIRSNRKTVSIQVNQDLSITVRAPQRVTQKEIKRILEKNDSWIQKHIEMLREKQAEA